MKTRHFILALVAMGVLAAAGYGAYRFGVSRGMQADDVASAPKAPISATSPREAGDVDPTTGKKVL